jgi:hypothetical protein
MGNAEIAVRDSSALMPSTIEEKLKMAGLLAKSGLVPQGLNTPEKVFAALQWGHELGLSPMSSVNNVVVINGRPTLSADIMHALARSNREYGGIVWKSRTQDKAEVEITRISPNGTSEKYTGYFDKAMAEAAGLLGKDTYKKYPDRMYRARALSRACKEAFPDVFSGVYSQEEADEIIPMRDVTEPPLKGVSAADLKADLAAERDSIPAAPGEGLPCDKAHFPKIAREVEAALGIASEWRPSTVEHGNMERALIKAELLMALFLMPETEKITKAGLR